MTLIPFWVKALVISLLLAGLVAACHHRDNGLREEGAAAQKAIDQAEADKLKAEAVLALATETQRVADAEKALRAAKDQQEITDAKNRNTVASLQTRLRDLAPAGRLRDPNQTGGCREGSGGPHNAVAATPSDRPDDGAAAGGLLSPELTRLLLDQADKADALNMAYAACRADGVLLRATAR